ncbi:MAG: thioredoxin fold domain-containing protein [Alphaproteobacteria bacterium]|jgi:thioredoxin 1|nr:thioredoxin fold domain-containing protein [Alphaproteobacteria bacterium]
MAAEDFAVFDDSNFDAQVLGRDGLTIVDFWSTTCVPCKQLKKVLGQVAEDVPENVVIGTVNGDENLDLLARYGVRGFPTLLFIKNGEVVETRTGVDRKQVLKKVIETHA